MVGSSWYRLVWSGADLGLVVNVIEYRLESLPTTPWWWCEFDMVYRAVAVL